MIHNLIVYLRILPEYCRGCRCDNAFSLNLTEIEVYLNKYGIIMKKSVDILSTDFFINLTFPLSKFLVCMLCNIPDKFFAAALSLS